MIKVGNPVSNVQITFKYCDLLHANISDECSLTEINVTRCI